MTIAPGKELDDLREVIEAYNGLAKRLEANQTALQQEVSRLKNELAEKNRELARKNRLEILGEMAAGVAHEIRNPLGGIELYAGLIGREAAGNDKVRTWAGKIQNATTDLSRIVGEILDFTRPLRPQMRDIEVGQVADMAIDMASAAIERSAVRIERRYGHGAVVRGDFNLLQRAFLNVILNAIDAMPDGGTITVATRPAEAGGEAAWEISFADTGTGIPAEDMGRIFDPFFTRKASGTGLGLAMTARITQAHEGKLSASNGRAGGAVFAFVLPAGTSRTVEA